MIVKTDGVPLFVEELTKLVLESGLLREAGDRYDLVGPLLSLAIPATLHDALMARLDRLATAKEVAQLGATLARTFTYEMLRAIAQIPEATLQTALQRLVESELLYQRGLPPQATYTFKHALVQDAAYESLLRSTRQQYHQRVAHVLVAEFPGVVEAQPELLAHHLTRAGLAAEAAPHWQRAGEHALERSAHLEAIGHLRQGLDVTLTLPENDARARQELALQIALGAALTSARGLAAPDVGHAYSRARVLCEQIGPTPELFPTLHGLFRYHLLRGEIRTAHELARSLPLVHRRLRHARPPGGWRTPRRARTLSPAIIGRPPR